MKLMSLKCPRCQGDLEGDNNNRVFFCRECAVGVDFSRGRQQEFALDFAAPAKESAADWQYFAFWRYEASYQRDPPDDQEEEGRSHRFWVPAFFIKNISYFGDIGLFYSNQEVDPATDRCRRAPIFAADRGEAHAAVYPRVYAAVRETARGARVVDLTPHSIRLTLVPFFHKGREFVDSQLGWIYPRGALI